VLATVHSSTCAEALQRIVSAFPAEIQSGVSAQLADCLLAAISQRLRFRAELNMRVPECEILAATHAVKNFIRNREFFKIASALETGAEHGMWSLARYRTWLDSRKNWHVAGQSPEPPESDLAEAEMSPLSLPTLSAATKGARPEKKTALPRESPGTGTPGRIEIEPVESEFGKILKRPGE